MGPEQSAGAPGAAGSARGARTREALLDAAEAAFAEAGFAAARLEDVAAAVGIRRASIVYHFPDKRALYEAVLARALGELRERVERALREPGPLAERIEAAVGAWADTVVERPALARLLLREVVDAPEGPSAALRAEAGAFASLYTKLVAEGERAGPGPEAGDEALDPLQLVSVIVGASVFLVGALPALAPAEVRGAAGAEARERHRRALRRIVRRLLPRFEDGEPRAPGAGGPPAEPGR